MADKVSVVFEALVGSSTQATFNALTKGFQKFAKGLRTTAVELKQMQQVQASNALGHMAKEMDKFIGTLGGMSGATKKSATDLSKLEAAFKSLTTIEGKTGQDAKKVLETFKNGNATYETTAKALNKLNIQAKITAQTQAFMATESAIVNKRWKELLPTIKNSDTSFNKAVSSTKGFGTALAHITTTLKLSGGRFKEFNRQLDYSKIKQAEQAGTIKLVSGAYQILNKSGYAALGITKQNIVVMQRAAQGMNVYEKAIRTAAEINKPLLASMMLLKKSAGDNILQFTRYSKTLFESEKALDKLKIALLNNSNVSAKALQGINRMQIALQAEAGTLKIAGNNFTILNNKGLKPFKNLTFEAARSLGMLGPKLSKVSSLEQALAVATKQNLDVVKKQTQALFDEGNSITQIVAALTKEQKVLVTSAAERLKLHKAGVLLAQSNQDVLKSSAQLTVKQERLQRALQALVNSLKAGKGEYSVMAAKVRILSTAFKAESAIVKKAVAEHQANLKSARDLGTEYRVLAGGLKIASDAQKRARKDMVDLIRAVKDGKPVSQARILWKGLAESFRRAAPAASMFQKVIARLSKSLRTYSSYMLSSRVLMSMADAFRLATVAVLDHDQALHDLKAIMNATNTDVRLLDKTLLSVASATKFSIGETAIAMRKFGQSGFTAAEAMAGMSNVAALATGTLESLEETVNLTATAVRVFHLGMDETGKVADVFANAVNRSRLTLRKLNIAFNYIGPLAAAAGLSLKDTTASMMLLANAGVRASTTGTGLRRVLAGLLKPSTKFAAAIKTAGYEIDDFNPLITDFSTIIQRLPAVVQDAGDSIEMFGLRGSSVVQAFASQGAVEFDRLKGTLDRVGSAAAMSAEQMRGLQMMLKNVKDRFGVLATSIARGGLLDIFRLLVQSTITLLTALNALAVSGIGKVLIPLGLLTTGFILAAAAIKALLSFSVVETFIASSVASLRYAGTLMTLNKAAIVATASNSALGKSIFAVAVGFKKMKLASLAFIATPVGAVLAAIGVVLTAVIGSVMAYKTSLKNVQEAQVKFSNAIENTTSALDKYFNTVEKYGAGSIRAAESAKTLYKSAKDLGTEYTGITDITDRLTSAIDKNTGVVRVSTEEFKQHGETLKSQYEGALLKSAIATEKLYATQQMQTTVWDTLKIALFGNWMGLKKLSDVTEKFRPQVEKASKAVADWIREFAEIEGWSESVGAAIDWIAGKWKSLADAMTPGANSLEEGIRAWDALVASAKKGDNLSDVEAHKQMNTEVQRLAASFYKNRDAVEITTDAIDEYIDMLSKDKTHGFTAIAGLSKVLKQISVDAKNTGNSIQSKLNYHVTALTKDIEKLKKGSVDSFAAQSEAVEKHTDNLIREIATQRQFAQMDRDTALLAHSNTTQQKLNIDAKYYQDLKEIILQSKDVIKKMLDKRKTIMFAAYGAELTNIGNFFDTKEAIELNDANRSILLAKKAIDAKIKIEKSSTAGRAFTSDRIFKLEQSRYATALSLAKKHQDAVIALSNERYKVEKQLLAVQNMSEEERSKKLISLEKINKATRVSALKEHVSAYKTAISDMLAEEDRLTAKIKKEKEKRAAFSKTIANDIQQLEESLLSEAEVNDNRRTAAIEAETQARESYLAGEFKESEKWIRKSRELWKSYSSIGEDGGPEFEAVQEDKIKALKRLDEAFYDNSIQVSLYADSQKDVIGSSMADLETKLISLQDKVQLAIKDMLLLGSATNMAPAIKELAAMAELLDKWTKDEHAIKLAFKSGAKTTIEALKEMVELWDALSSKTIDLFIKKSASGGIAKPVAEGGVIGLAAGGKVSSFFKKLTQPLITKGSGTKDDVPAMLMKDEYVFKQSAVKRLGVPLLDALNNGAADLSSIFADVIQSLFSMGTGNFGIPQMSMGGAIGAGIGGDVKLQDFGNLTIDVAGKKIDTIVHKDVISELNEHLTNLKRFGT